MSNLLKVNGVKALAFVATFAFAVAPAMMSLMVTVKAVPATPAEVNAVVTPTDDSTPEYTFYSAEEGLLVFGGACNSATHYAEVGNNVISFNALADGEYDDCTIKIFNDDGLSAALAVSTFEVDTIAPVIEEVSMFDPAVVNALTVPGDADYVFVSDEDGTYEFSGDCSTLTGAVTADVDVTEDFTALADETYANCGVTVEDAAGNVSNKLTLPSILVDTTFDGSYTLMPAPADVFAPNLNDPTTVSSDTFRVSNDSGESLLFYVTDTSVLEGGVQDCYVPEVQIADEGIGTITAHYLATGAYNGAVNSCILTVEDAAGNTGTLSLNAAGGVVADTVVPVVTLGTVPTSTFDSTLSIPVTVTGADAVLFTVSGANCLAGGATVLDGTHYAMPGAATVVKLATLDNTDPGVVDFDDCVLTATDATGGAGHFVDLTIPEFTVTDSTPVTLSIVTPVETPTTDSTPNVVIHSSAVGIVQDTALTSACGVASSTANVVDDGVEYTVTLDTITTNVPLADGTYANCKVAVDDGNGNISNVSIPMFVVDSTDPVLAIVEAPAATTDPTPSIIFSSDEAGEITYGGACGEGSLENAVDGNNTVTYGPLANAPYAGCSIIVTDVLGNASIPLVLPAFTLADPTDVALDEVSIDNASLIYTFTSNKPGAITYNHICTSTTTEAVAGTNTIVLNWLPAGLDVEDCSLEIGGETLNMSDFTVAQGPVDGTVWRFFNKKNGAHLYTISETERDTVMTLTAEWQYEGPKYVVYETQEAGTVPVYRFFNTRNGAHLYTSSEVEKQTVMTTLPHFTYEGVKYYVAPTATAESTDPVYRFFNTRNGAHLYTTSDSEKQTIQTTLPYFNYEGVKYYVMPL